MATVPHSDLIVNMYNDVARRRSNERYEMSLVKYDLKLLDDLELYQTLCLVHKSPEMLAQLHRRYTDDAYKTLPRLIEHMQHIVEEPSFAAKLHALLTDVKLNVVDGLLLNVHYRRLMRCKAEEELLAYSGDLVPDVMHHRMYDEHMWETLQLLRTAMAKLGLRSSYDESPFDASKLCDADFWLPLSHRFHDLLETTHFIEPDVVSLSSTKNKTPTPAELKSHAFLVQAQVIVMLNTVLHIWHGGTIHIVDDVYRILVPAYVGRHMGRCRPVWGGAYHPAEVEEDLSYVVTSYGR